MERDLAREAEVDERCGAREFAWKIQPEKLDREDLEQWGKILDQHPKSLRGRTAGMALGRVNTI